MKYICSARLKHITEPAGQIDALATLLGLTPEQHRLIQNIEPFVDAKHVAASQCFRTWFPALDILRKHNAIQVPLGNGFVIKDVSARFTRFENQLFLYFLVENPSMPASENELTTERDAVLEQFISHYGEQLDTDFHVTSKVVEFHELLRLQPVTPVFDAASQPAQDIRDAFAQQTSGKGYTRHSRIGYANDFGRKHTKDGIVPFVREQASVLCLHADTQLGDGATESAERCHVYNMVHTELVFFQRTQDLEERLGPTYRRIDFLKELVHILEDQWIRIRTYFSVAPKFALFRGGRTAHLFFNLLEVNGQVLALQNSIISRMDREHVKMQERYERLHFNAQQSGTADEQAFLQATHEEVSRSFSAYRNNTDTLKSAVSRLDNGISQLRGDFDSNTNIVLQMLVFVLSIVLVLWGVITLGFDKGFDITGQTPLDILSLLVFMVASLTTIFGAFLLGARMFVNRATRVMKRSADRVIQTSLENDGKLNDEIVRQVEEHLQRLEQESRSKKSWRNMQGASYMHRINQLLEVVIMLLPAVSLRHLDIKRADGFLDKAKESLGIKQ